MPLPLLHPRLRTRRALSIASLCLAVVTAACAPILDIDETYYEVCGTEFTDDFDRPDATELGVAWEEITGDLAIAGNELRNAPAPANTPHMAICYGMTSASQRVSARFAAPAGGGGRFGIVFRAQDAENYSVLRRLTGATVELQLVEVVNGFEGTTKLEAQGLAQAEPNDFFRLAVLANGGAVRYELDDPNFPIVSNDVIVDGPVVEGMPGVRIDAVGPNQFLRVDDFAASVE